MTLVLARSRGFFLFQQKYLKILTIRISTADLSKSNFNVNAEARTASSIQRERLSQINTRANLVALAAAEMNCLSGLTFSEESQWRLQLEFTFLPIDCLFFEGLSLCKHFQLLFNIKWNQTHAHTHTHTCTDPFPVTNEQARHSINVSSPTDGEL